MLTILSLGIINSKTRLKMNKLISLLLVIVVSSCAVRQPRDGVNGTQGVAGKKGSDAQPCTLTSIPGGVEIACPGQDPQFVLNGAEGPAGQKGDSGDQGPQGPAGAPGLDATPVMPVALCTGQTVYPAAFAEYGLCVNNDLYGVYWDGTNAWLTKIVPGNYVSTSTSVPCSLTVGPNCSVTH